MSTLILVVLCVFWSPPMGVYVVLYIICRGVWCSQHEALCLLVCAVCYVLCVGARFTGVCYVLYARRWLSHSPPTDAYCMLCVGVWVSRLSFCMWCVVCRDVTELSAYWCVVYGVCRRVSERALHLLVCVVYCVYGGAWATLRLLKCTVWCVVACDWASPPVCSVLCVGTGVSSLLTDVQYASKKSCQYRLPVPFNRQCDSE